MKQSDLGESQDPTGNLPSILSHVHSIDRVVALMVRHMVVDILLRSIFSSNGYGDTVLGFLTKTGTYQQLFCC